MGLWQERGPALTQGETDKGRAQSRRHGRRSGDPMGYVAEGSRVPKERGRLVPRLSDYDSLEVTG